MGLLNKLKNVLFEGEEIEIPETDVMEEGKNKEKEKESLKKKEPVKMTFESDDEMMSDRELFKAEPTFNFPMFDEDEFESVKEEIPETPKFEVIEEPKTRAKAASSMLDVPVKRTNGRSISRENRYEEKEPIYKEPRKSREVREKNTRENRKFTPSPVISPVYGLLDKSYKKEEVVAKSEDKKTIDVDSVRKKAFGTLEDDIEKTLNTPIHKFYEETPKKKEKKLDEVRKESSDSKESDLDELLRDSAEDIIYAKEDEPILPYTSFTIEEDSIKSDIEDTKELEILDRPLPKKEKDLNKLENTLENDLFDLIDSMYETREDGE